jgi:hypothetical protein
MFFGSQRVPKWVLGREANVDPLTDYESDVEDEDENDRMDSQGC